MFETAQFFDGLQSCFWKASVQIPPDLGSMENKNIKVDYLISEAPRLFGVTSSYNCFLGKNKKVTETVLILTKKHKKSFFGK